MPKIPELDLSKIVLENVVAEPDKKSLDEAMNSVRESGIEYKPVKEGGKSKKKDQVTLDFEGFIDGKPFENGSSKDFPLVLGSNSFIPGFEDQLIGVQKNDEKIVKVAFPNSAKNKPTLTRRSAIFLSSFVATGFSSGLLLCFVSLF